jgi:hypothetical protein
LCVAALRDTLLGGKGAHPPRQTCAPSTGTGKCVCECVCVRVCVCVHVQKEGDQGVFGEEVRAAVNARIAMVRRLYETVY